MNDQLEQQLVNHLRDLLKQLNESYKDFFHFQLLTIVDMKEESCLKCTTSECKPKCLRSVIGYQSKEQACGNVDDKSDKGAFEILQDKLGYESKEFFDNGK